jgi:hypothetical protein
MKILGGPAISTLTSRCDLKQNEQKEVPIGAVTPAAADGADIGL